VSEGRRNEFAAFGWNPDEVPDPQAPDTFQRSKLDWSDLEREPHARLFQWHRDLIHLRRTLPDLSDGRLDRVQVRYDEAACWLTMQRGAVTVACNLAASAQPVPLPAGTGRTILLASESGIELTVGSIQLPPSSVAILG
ncbi:MAG: DUF3459 domain-containing protein, partial [Ktedonobacterales bacterium]